MSDIAELSAAICKIIDQTPERQVPLSQIGDNSRVQRLIARVDREKVGRLKRFIESRSELFKMKTEGTVIWVGYVNDRRSAVKPVIKKPGRQKNHSHHTPTWAPKPKSPPTSLVCLFDADHLAVSDVRNIRIAISNEIARTPRCIAATNGLPAEEVVGVQWVDAGTSEDAADNLLLDIAEEWLFDPSVSNDAQLALVSCDCQFLELATEIWRRANRKVCFVLHRKNSDGVSGVWELARRLDVDFWEYRDLDKSLRRMRAAGISSRIGAVSDAATATATATALLETETEIAATAPASIILESGSTEAVPPSPPSPSPDTEAGVVDVAWAAERQSLLHRIAELEASHAELLNTHVHSSDEFFSRWWASLKVAWQAGCNGQFRDAIRHFNDVLQAVPHLQAGLDCAGRAVRLRGYAHMQLQQWLEAAKDFDTVLHRRSDDEQVLYWRAACLYQMGLPGLAADDLRRLIALRPHDNRLRDLLARVQNNNAPTR